VGLVALVVVLVLAVQVDLVGTLGTISIPPALVAFDLFIYILSAA
jgi:hypothetical protein